MIDIATLNKNGHVVYAHVNKINDKIYIGMTKFKPEHRFGKNGKGYLYYDTFFCRAIKKYGWDNFDHLILKDGLTVDEACLLEQELIALYETTNAKYGYNSTTGGDYNYGFSDATIEKMSNAMKGKFAGEKHPMFGRKHTEETRRLMSDIQRNPVCVYDRHTGEFLIEYSCTVVAEEILGIPNSHISAVCLKKNRYKTAGGYIFRYKKELGDDYMRPITQEELDYINSSNCNIKVCQYNLLGKKINTFDMCTDAGRHINARGNNISNAIKHQTWYFALYIWMPYQTHKDIEQLDKSFVDSLYPKIQRDLPIIKYSLEGEYLEEYATYKEAVASLEGKHGRASAVSQCLHGDVKTAYGFVWKRKDLSDMV